MNIRYTFSLLALIILLSIYSNSYSQLNGNYIIGSGGDYLTLTAAFADLHSAGINGTVVFYVKTGSYDESVTLDSVPGSSHVNTITFRSQTGIASDVLLYSSSTSLFVIKLRGADFIRISSMTINDFHLVFPQRNRILFEGHCNDVQITGNSFLGGNNDAGISSINATLHNLMVNENSFYLQKGVFMQQSTFERSFNTSVIDNEFICINGISLYRHDGLLIEKNFMRVKTESFFGNYAIYLADCNDDLRILKNKIMNNSTGTNATDGIKVDPYYGTGALIANNFISIQTGTGMYIGDCNNMKIFYNTIYCSDYHSGDIALILSHDIVLRNNLFVELFDEGTSTLTLYVSSSTFNSDYNDFYYVCPYMLRYNELGYITDLTQFRSLTGQDLNSVERQVFLVSPPDLHLAGTSIGDLNLAGTPLTEVTDDIDRDLRDPVHPYMGADEADVPLPVELISFTSNINQRDVTLNWTTSFEQNNSGFEIEKSEVKSQMSNDWLKIGFVKGNGTTNSINDYSYIDRNLSPGKYSYRLKQIDFNGNFEYHNLGNEVVIGFPEKFSLSQNYPNPFNPNTIINFEIPPSVKVQMANVRLIVYNSLGIEIATLIDKDLEAGYHSVAFNGANFSSGVYFYTLLTENFKEAKRMILLK